eukprot:TRINITY_DN4427_c0_g1_i1.p2 TRINITY_DN4427_c0_g1~~TRINITY_DN4427_c0_g1_i1.p2  ORF type:complete len:143 (-),score=21.98 TRINITY_DN4427_c0_g1_i1:128-556(-)
MSLKTFSPTPNSQFKDKEIQFSSLTSNASTDVNSLRDNKKYQIQRNYSEGEQSPTKPIIIKSKFLKSMNAQKHNSVFDLGEDEQRKDRFGNLIVKGSKQHHISVGGGEVIEVESYKQFNENMMKIKIDEEEDQGCQNICNIF